MKNYILENKERLLLIPGFIVTDWFMAKLGFAPMYLTMLYLGYIFITTFDKIKVNKVVKNSLLVWLGVIAFYAVFQSILGYYHELGAEATKEAWEVIYNASIPLLVTGVIILLAQQLLFNLTWAYLANQSGEEKLPLVKVFLVAALSELARYVTRAKSASTMFRAYTGTKVGLNEYRVLAITSYENVYGIVGHVILLLLLGSSALALLFDQAAGVFTVFIPFIALLVITIIYPKFLVTLFTKINKIIRKQDTLDFELKRADIIKGIVLYSVLGLIFALGDYFIYYGIFGFSIGYDLCILFSVLGWIGMLVGPALKMPTKILRISLISVVIAPVFGANAMVIATAAYLLRSIMWNLAKLIYHTSVFLYAMITKQNLLIGEVKSAINKGNKRTA